MTDWTIGLSTGCFYRTSIFDVLGLIRESGISSLEICSSRDHLDYHDINTVKRAAGEIAKHGLEVFSFHAPFDKEIDISGINDNQRARSLADVLTAVEAAGALGARYFVLHPGPEEARRPPAEKYLDRLLNASGSLEKIAGQCSRHGMMLALENMLPHLLFGRLPDLFWVLGSLKARDVGLCLDTGHAFLEKVLYTEIERFSSHLLMIHAADNHGEQDDHLPPGKGNIDWLHVVKALAGSGFTGPIILELSGQERDNPEARLREAVEARRFLRELCRRPDL
jgi:sugar phosphate isomerase/epimerase